MALEKLDPVFLKCIIMQVLCQVKEIVIYISFRDKLMCLGIQV